MFTAKTTKASISNILVPSWCIFTRIAKWVRIGLWFDIVYSLLYHAKVTLFFLNKKFISCFWLFLWQNVELLSQFAQISGLCAYFADKIGYINIPFYMNNWQIQPFVSQNRKCFGYYGNFSAILLALRQKII
jgi:hypothetical protein